MPALTDDDQLQDVEAGRDPSRLDPLMDYDGSDVEIAYHVTRGEIPHMIARDSAGQYVDLDEDEAESCALDILAKQTIGSLA